MVEENIIKKDTEIKEAIQSSISYAEALRKLNLKPCGGNYKTLKTQVEKLNLDISHMLHQGHSKGKSLGHKHILQDYLDNKFPIKSYNLKLRLLKENVVPYKCHDCSLELWKGRKIPLELHHIDGNPVNNNLDNLILLCPNCHAQTPNYRNNKRL